MPEANTNHGRRPTPEPAAPSTSNTLVAPDAPAERSSSTSSSGSDPLPPDSRAYDRLPLQEVERPHRRDEAQRGRAQDEGADGFVRARSRSSSMGSGMGASAAAAPNPGRLSFTLDSPFIAPPTPTTPGFGHRSRSPSPYGDYGVYGGNTGYRRPGAHVDFSVDTGDRSRLQSASSLDSSTYQPYENLSDAERLKGSSPPDLYHMQGPRQDFIPTHACPAKKHFFRTKWIATSIILISIYSTVFSGIFLGIALKEPRWPMIHDNGTLTPANASLLTAVFAKTIELTFGTAIVSFIGQVLSRRSLSVRSGGKGVTLAEFSMRNWIMQPGNMITHWETVRYAGFSVLGAISFVAAIVAMLYTSASDALVQPQLRFGHLEHKSMQAQVITQWANAEYLQYKCQSPIALSEDPNYRNTTCVDISYAASAYHDYQRFLAEWNARGLNTSGGGVVEREQRVPGYSLYQSETLVNGTWLEAMATEWNGRVVNNVSLAMPHSGVLQAAQDKRNAILQPAELGGLGAYSLVGSTPNPVVHVLCANMNRSELAPVVYEAWPNAGKLNTSTWPAQVDFYGNDTWLNSTVVDDLFGWGETNGQHAPVFPKYPIEYNTVLNQTFSYGRVSVYLLGRDGDPDEERYALCQLKASLTPNCSTTYLATHEGSSLSSTCNPEHDDMAYIHSAPGARSGTATESRDWPWIASEWANSLSLNAGITDGKASIARILTQMILRQPKLSATEPSLAETLAVLAGSTLLMSTQDAQMDMNWNRTDALLPVAETRAFNATLRARTYASGAVGSPQRGFYVVLILGFATNVLCLSYFLFYRRLVTDFSEPPNMFSLAINSPPAAVMSGSCGGGPADSQWHCEWFVGETGGHLFVLPREVAHGYGRGDVVGHPMEVEEESSHPHHHHHHQHDQTVNGGGVGGGHRRTPSALSGLKKHFSSGSAFARGSGYDKARLSPMSAVFEHGGRDARPGTQSTRGDSVEMASSPITRAYSKLSKRRTLL